MYESHAETKQGGGGLSYSEEVGIMWEYLSEEESDFLFDEIFEKKIYLRNGISITEGDTILDVGANIGHYCLFVSYLSTLSDVSLPLASVYYDDSSLIFLQCSNNSSKYNL